MASQLEIATTGENAKKSTGLTTSEGKSITSRNALKAGLDAKSEILRFENRAELDLLTSEHYARFTPTVPERRFLVDSRYLSAAAATGERSFNAMESPSLGVVFLRSADAFSRVQRRLDSAQRNHATALKQLLTDSLPTELPPPPLPSREREGAVAKHSESFQTPSSDVAPAIANEALNPGLAQFLISRQPASIHPVCHTKSEPVRQISPSPMEDRP